MGEALSRHREQEERKRWVEPDQVREETAVTELRTSVPHGMR